MISPNRAYDMACRRMMMRHVKRDSLYVFVAPAKGKIDGEWVNGASYQCISDGLIYWRPLDGFNGFEEFMS